MKVIKTPLNGCLVFEPRVFSDERGSFVETYKREVLNSALGYNVDFVQDNQSYSTKGVLRGLHFQKGAYSQAKMVRVSHGSVLDVAVDLRKESPTFGHSFSVELNAENGKQLFVPRGFAHGFVVLSKAAIFCYKCDNYYHNRSERGVIYNDPTLAIDWQLPIEQLKLSDKDLMLPSFKNVDL